MFQTTSTFFMVVLGVSIAVATRVGNFLGAGCPVSAQRTALLGVTSCAGKLILKVLRILA